jgi:pyridoxamine 5'-phosphate oxidase
MDKKEIYAFMNENRAFYMATCEGDVPHVRGLFLHKADDSGIYFTTGKMRDLYRQLKRNPKVELCFHKELFQLRINGIVEDLDNDLDLKKEILAARPFMKPWIDAAGFDPMAVFKVTKGVATWWSMDKTLAPKEYLEI